MAKDVILKLNGEQVFPKTYVRNILDIDENGKQVSLASVLNQFVEADQNHTSRLNGHDSDIAGLRNRVTEAENAHRALASRVTSVEDRVSANETSINNINQTIGSHATQLGNHEGRIGVNEADIAAIKDVIPTAATKDNQLADKDFVNSSINNIAAYYITKDAEGNPFATKAELDSATVFYSGGEERIPTRNDYTLVLEDESRVPEGDEDGSPTTRYIFDEQWEFQYIVNNTSLTADQLKAINSGITSELVAKITANESNIGALTQTVADNKTAIEERVALIDGATGRLATIESDLGTLTQTVTDNKTALDKEITDIKENIANGIVGDLTSLDGRLDVAEEEIVALKQELNGIPADSEGNGAVVGIKERLTTAEGDIDALEGRMDTAESDIDSAEVRLDALEIEINGAPANEEAGTEKVVGIKERLDGHDQNISDINQDIADLRVLIDEKQADLTAGEFITIEELEDGSQKIDVVVDQELSSESRNPISNQAVKAELDKKIECVVEATFDEDIENIGAEARIVALEKEVATLKGTVSYLVNEIENLKALHNGGAVTPDQPSAPTQAPANVQTTSTDISFDEVPGATGYNAYVDGNHVGSF